MPSTINFAKSIGKVIDMSQIAEVIKSSYQQFSEVARDYINIKDDEHYQESLAFIEELLEEAEDGKDDSINGLIEIIAHAIERYESKDPDIVQFEQEAMSVGSDVAVLRLLMQQYNLTGADFPEIGDRSLVSRILSGSRSLTKSHIQSLSERFNLNPAWFFVREQK